MAPTHLYTLSLHDALPIFTRTVSSAGIFFHQDWGSQRGLWYGLSQVRSRSFLPRRLPLRRSDGREWWRRSEEHTSELQSRRDLVCRPLPEKKKAAERAP